MSDGTDDLDHMDAQILAEIDDAFAVLDPPPADLDERVIVTLATSRLDAELARLVEDVLVRPGARASGRVRTVRFESAGLEVLLQVVVTGTGAVRVDGWLAPAGVAVVELRTSDDVCLGEGLTTAMTQALATVEPGRFVDDVYCDINGERYRTEEWGFALLRVQERLRSTTYKTPVGDYGDVGAATGALLLILAVQAWQRGYSGGDLSMVWSSSDRGLRSAAVVERGNAR